MNRLLLMTGAAATLALTADAVARMPASSFDSNTAALDTRTGTVNASVNQALDSRTGSQDISNFRGLNTTKVGTEIVIR